MHPRRRTTVCLFLRVGSIHEKNESAVVISRLVTFIAMYLSTLSLFLRIFNAWVDAYSSTPPSPTSSTTTPC